MSLPTAIRDNRAKRGSAGDFLKDAIQDGSALSFVSAYFTVHAYHALKDKLDAAKSLRFLFGEPSFISLVDQDKAASKNYSLTEKGMTLANTLPQRRLARECAEWIKQKVEVRSIIKPGFLHGKMYHVQNAASQALLGSSNFTVPGLGLHASAAANNVELNIVVDSDRDRKDLLAGLTNSGTIHASEGGGFEASGAAVWQSIAAVHLLPHAVSPVPKIHRREHGRRSPARQNKPL